MKFSFLLSAAKMDMRGRYVGASQNELRMIQCMVSSCAFRTHNTAWSRGELGERNCDRIARGLKGCRVPKEQPTDGGPPYGNQERRGANPPGRWRKGYRGAAQERPPDGARARCKADRPRHGVFRA